ncbi:MFS transporter [Aquisalibacillus elongatus]|uniref:MFS transporter n=1 Tax=Aquisalibacillus elongatus TaxID=485577 RepID=A0A3N5BH30_9BACI|nr:MFS transporter [Aquisalibacillus elongatus]RPF57086.1 MFS transporter [Aquisalibacillus elongatus]
MFNKLTQTSFYYGWVIAAIASLGLFFSGPGQTFAISMFTEIYMEEFNLSPSTVSNLYSIATLIAGFLLFTIGKLTDIYGQRVMMVVVGLGLAFATFWNAMITGPVMMFFGFFMLRIFGQGSMTLVPNTLVPQWFLEKRGRAFSVMAVGGFAAASLFPPLNAFLVQQISWRMTWVFWGVALLVIFIPLVILFVRNKPEDVGEVIDGRAKGRPKTRSSSRLPVFLLVSLNALILLTLIPPIHETLTERFDWIPNIYVRLIVLAALLVSLFFLIKTRRAKGEQVDVPEPSSESEDVKEDQEVSWTLKEAMKTRAFWVILFCVSVPAMTNTGITFHLVSIADNKGLSLEIAALVLSLMAIIGFPVTFVSGYLVDRFKVNYILAVTFLIHVVAISWLYFASSATGAIIYGVIWGLAHGFERIVLNIVWPNYFGRVHLGSIKSIAQSTMVVGSALGPLPFGYFYEWFNGFGEILLVMLIFPLTAMLLAIFSPAPRYEDYHG